MHGLAALTAGQSPITAPRTVRAGYCQCNAVAQLTIQQAFDLALQHRQAGRLHEAEQICRHIVARQPKHAEAHNNLGNLLAEKGQFDEAITTYRQAIALVPNYAEAHSNLGNALTKQGQLDEALAAYRRAIALNPNLPDAQSNLGAVLRTKGQLDEAIAAHRRAIALRPNFPAAHSNLGVALRDKGQLDDAIAAYRQAIEFNPNIADLHYNLAFALLLQGDFQQGWKEHEWRWKFKEFSSTRRNLAQPLWNGSDLTGRTILLHAEQGLGDTIQFVRYVPLVAERGGKVIFGGQPQLRRLLQGVPGIAKWLAAGEVIPPFDVHCPLLSLPLAFRTTLESIPSKLPYLFPDPELLRAWRPKLAAYPAQLKVGVAWAGKPTHENDRNRSMTLAQLAPLMQVPGARFFSLQKGEPAAQARTLPAALRLVDWTDDLNDFADTAALIANLDLVISVDTAVAHLAGAMGKPVWLMLPFAPDWRWLLDQSDSPWYPTMRLFRQTVRAEWNSVILRIADALSLWTKSQPPATGSSSGE